MGEISLRQGLTAEETEALLRWANAGGADFLRQFAGPKWAYPLTAAQVAAEAASICAILEDGAFAGIVQVLGRQDGTVRIGRFLVDPDRAGRGVGARALRRLCAQLFEDDTVEAVALNVYRFNGRAMRCYRKCGFTVTHTTDRDGPWGRVGMALRRPGKIDGTANRGG